MENNERSVHPQIPPGFVLAPIHTVDDGTPLRLCILTRTEPDATGNSFVLLRELPGSRVYLGAVCDADTRPPGVGRSLGSNSRIARPRFSGYQERLANHTFDERWRSEYEMSKSACPTRWSSQAWKQKIPALWLSSGAAPKPPQLARLAKGRRGVFAKTTPCLNRWACRLIRLRRSLLV